MIDNVSRTNKHYLVVNRLRLLTLSEVFQTVLNFNKPDF